MPANGSHRKTLVSRFHSYAAGGEDAAFYLTSVSGSKRVAVLKHDNAQMGAPKTSGGAHLGGNLVVYTLELLPVNTFWTLGEGGLTYSVEESTTSDAAGFTDAFRSLLIVTKRARQ